MDPERHLDDEGPGLSMACVGIGSCTAYSGHSKKFSRCMDASGLVDCSFTARTLTKAWSEHGTGNEKKERTLAGVPPMPVSRGKIFPFRNTLGASCVLSMFLLYHHGWIYAPSKYGKYMLLRQYYSIKIICLMHRV